MFKTCLLGPQQYNRQGLTNFKIFDFKENPSKLLNQFQMEKKYSKDISFSHFKLTDTIGIVILQDLGEESTSTYLLTYILGENEENLKFFDFSKILSIFDENLKNVQIEDIFEVA